MKLFLLDAYALIFRAYYALMRNPRFTSSGINTSAIFGFVNSLQDVLKKERPTHIAVCFDPPGGTFRHEAYKEYKANRDETPEDIKLAVPYIKRIIKAYNIPVIEVPGFEADDVIGTLAHLAGEHGFETYMMTPDKDFGQLVTEKVKIYHPGRKGREVEIQGVKEINAKYGFTSPLQVIDLLALQGDAVDNIPGCPGVGEVTAKKLVREFGSVENLLANTDKLKGALHRKVTDNVEQIKFSKFLATIKTDVPVKWDEELLRRKPANMHALAKVFKELEFRTLAVRIIEHGEANVGVKNAPAPAEALKNVSRAELEIVNHPKKDPGQPSLFDALDTKDIAQLHPEVIEMDNIDSHEHDYRLVADDSEAAQLVEKLIAAGEPVGVCLVADGEEAMRAHLVGLAVSSERYKAAFMPLDDMGWMMSAVSPLFDGKVQLVSNDIKRDIVMLNKVGINYRGDYYDTAVAHYLLQPERSHSTRLIAEDLLKYQAINAESLIGAKGKKQKKFADVKPEKLINWACEMADLALALKPELDKRLEENGMTHLLTDIEMPLVRVLASMELAGARIDEKALAEYSVKLTEQVDALDRECHKLAGMEFNTASPAQVGEVLFGHLKIDAKAKKTKTGQYSTTEEVLMKLRDRHPLVDKILELRGLRKLLSTYVNALPALVNPRTGRIHTTYNQTVTATGRLSSVNPNLQNIPVRSDDGKEIRRAFIPADGNVFFSADYSQIELRLVADLSDDSTMLDAFAKDEDIHAITAAKIYHEDLDKVTGDQRRKAKTANFGILYGISAFGLSQRLNISRSEAKMLIEGYFETFPKVKEYIERSVAQAREKGYVTTLFGRRRMLPDINSRNAVVRSFSERNAVNAPIQGTAADVIKIAMISICRRFEEEGIRSKMILQVHDELNFDVIPSELEKVTQIVVTEMENAYHGKVKLTASYGAASNWLDAH
ncbi:MAG: DNA polymerase I [Muribaculaceae bacterium]|nr:DNA polymerase I [Muribaculaceae bacterium]